VKEERREFEEAEVEGLVSPLRAEGVEKRFGKDMVESEGVGGRDLSFFMAGSKGESSASRDVFVEMLILLRVSRSVSSSSASA
jgi:hypothetical protein